MPPITLLPLNGRDIHFVLSTPWGESQREGPIRRLGGRQSGGNSMLIPPYVLIIRRSEGQKARGQAIMANGSEIPKYKGKSGILQMTNPMNFCLLFV